MKKTKENVLILGADSGIGNGILKKFKKNDFEIFASKRKLNNDKIKNFFQFNYLKDFNNKKKIKKNFKDIKFNYILFLASITPKSKYINNAKCKFGNLDYNNFLKFVTVNCYANLKIFEHLQKQNFLKTNAKIVFFSSMAGSTENRGKLKHNKPFGNIIYRISKAALNNGIKNLSYDFKNKYIIIAMHPGYVKTKSGGKNADYTIGYASQKLYKTIINLSKKDNGKFLDLKGKKIQW